MRNSLTGLAAAVLFAAVAWGGAVASEAPDPPAQDWSFKGVFGTYDRAALRRGLQVYREVCSFCHSLDMVPFRALAGAGFSKDGIKAVSASYEVPAGPGEDGRTHDGKGARILRKALPTDPFPAPFENEKAARYYSDGSLPVDLSLIAKGRRGGPDYLYALLTGYPADVPEGMPVGDGKFYNTIFVGHRISMPPPLSDGSVAYADGSEASLDRMARDVTTFLMWAAEPKMEERKAIGRVLIVVTVVLTGLLVLINRRVWKRLDSASANADA